MACSSHPFFALSKANWLIQSALIPLVAKRDSDHSPALQCWVRGGETISHGRTAESSFFPAGLELMRDLVPSIQALVYLKKRTRYPSWQPTG
jgi:hypothetical protein